MNIVVTGSLGYVSQPLTEKLLQKGHSVTVISSNPDKQKKIEALGARAAIGIIDDVDFIINTFTGADAVYCMLAPYGNLADPTNTADEVIKRAETFVTNYKQAIEKSGVKRIVYLSSIGADKATGSGLISVHYHAENTLRALPSDVNVSFIRAAGFYKNMLGYIHTLKHHNSIAASYGGDDRVVWVSNLDIADAVVNELESQETDRKVSYVASEELSCTEAAAILGTAIGKPDLTWQILTDQQQLMALKAHGMNDSIAHNFVEMNASIHNGTFYEDYDRHKLALGKVKLKDFAREFAVIYQQQ
ncbi:SDR family oxidoreductase [Xanthocytophaga flava]|uniref:SDR family oxidoreductase n=1 Tax=Xanthocytophaga flava TaxID=3048013 RepID=UPI0028D30696|nr:NAD(P)H-binding protein [Xanthocytophaga flavus]MDJ1467319.1 NAD(P)H-binding protein [Xanthocytophaga flavus]